LKSARPLFLLTLLALAAVAALLLNLSTGSFPLNLVDAFNNTDGAGRKILLQLRLPRALTAFVTGALLSIAGALMQVLLRNPLADPYILGISGGASTGALLAILAGAGSGTLHSSAFVGALVSTLLVFALAHGHGKWDTTRLLLTGVVLAAGWGAIISLLLAISPAALVHGMLFWLMGDLGISTLPWTAGLTLAAGLALALYLAPALNLLAAGELKAASLGVAVGRVRIVIYVAASLLTATAVTLAGNIGFVGLIAPHILRLLGARDYRSLIPGSALLGGTLLVLADALARSVIAPRQLPTGVLTAMLGVPLFLYLLYHARSRHHE
jgi:iron complex transport system permease protein